MRTTFMRAAELSVALVVAGCATTTPGAAPHEMSASQHEAAAQREEQQAAAHAAQYDPNLVLSRVPWKSVVNPTEAHLRMAEEHRKRAADHRAGSAALRDAEARACVGVSADDRDMSPFEHREDIESVTPLNESISNSKLGLATKSTGAVVTIRAVPGLTAEWLQRIVDCHLARNAALGHVVPEMPDCPLVPKGVEARVTSTGSGFAVAIRSDDPSTAREILARAERLVRPASNAAR